MYIYRIEYYIVSIYGYQLAFLAYVMMYMCQHLLISAINMNSI